MGIPDVQGVAWLLWLLDQIEYVTVLSFQALLIVVSLGAFLFVFHWCFRRVQMQRDADRIEAARYRRRQKLAKENPYRFRPRAYS